MNDFEKRLGQALSAGAEEAPATTVGLAAQARRRARTRRRTTMVGAATAVALAVAVPIGVVGLGSDDPSDVVADRVEDPNIGEVADTKATRTETWRDVTLEVPLSWRYGSLAGWCASDGDLDTPLVQRPGQLTPLIACSPTRSFGVRIGREEVPTGFAGVEQREVVRIPAAVGLDGWTAYWSDEGDLVHVSAPRRETTQAVIDSVRRFEDVDPNGCAALLAATDEAVVSDQMSVCRYDPDGRLVQSERLSADETKRAVSALKAAPTKQIGEPTRACPPPREDETSSTVVLGGVATLERLRLRYAGRCEQNAGILGRDSFQELTGEVLFWAFSPGWADEDARRLGPDFPFPERFRQ